MKYGTITKKFNKNDKIWVVGDFNPSIFRTKKFEFGIHKHKKGDKGIDHKHEKSTEINVVLFGAVRVKNKTFGCGSYFIFEKNEWCGEVEFLKQTVLLVMRDGSYPKDKVIAK